MSEHATTAQNGLDEQMIRSVCQEAQTLATKVAGAMRRLSVQAGEYRVEIEWADTTAGATGVALATPQPMAAAGVGTASGDGATETGHAIVAPLVGTFYRSPEPGAKAFVEEGDVVEAGQPIGIVEAMKIMNRIEADRAGRVSKILVGDGEMVEFGQPLIMLEPTD